MKPNIKSRKCIFIFSPKLIMTLKKEKQKKGIC